MVHAEQGLGDTFQFCRFLKRARARVGRLVFLCHPPLASVLVGVRGVDDFCFREESLPEFDFHIPLMSLPFVLGVRGEVAVGGPYLRAEEVLEKHWGDRLRESPGFKVGLCWRGNPGYRDDVHRSMELSQLTPLWTVGDVTFVNLQKDDVEGELKQSGNVACILDWTAEMDEERGAFVDSAALLCGLDLLITSDTAIAHLAGALGRPVWLLLPRFADWRWGGDEETTRWYPSMKIFRQRDQGDWGEVIGRVREALVVQLSRTSRS